MRAGDEMSGGSRKGDAPGSDRADDGKPEPVSDASVEGADADESGYRRDDYWREEGGSDGLAPDEVPEPSQGYDFESTDEKAKSDGKKPEKRSPEAEEQGNAGGRDDARIVDDD